MPCFEGNHGIDSQNKALTVDALDLTQSVCVAAPVVAVRSPVHLCSLASCYNIDNIEDSQTFKININLRVHVVTIGSPKIPSR